MLLGKIKLYDIAKELNLTSKEVLEIAKKLNIEAKSHLSAVDEVNQFKDYGCFVFRAVGKLK